jgi:hypothetical protein
MSAPQSVSDRHKPSPIVTPILLLITEPRPALGNLIAAMERLSRIQRNEVARFGRRARAAKVPRIRRLTREAAAEARRLREA